jgi:hypothetical protein
MSVSLYDLTIGSYVQILEGAVGFLDQGARHCQSQGIALEDLVATRLYPDMADLHFQVTSMTHHSLGAVEGLRKGQFGPPSFEPCDYEALQAMTQSTLETLKTQDRTEIEGLAEGRVLFKLGEHEIPFTAINFALSFSLPNFYFHTTTAYDILRSKGVPLGKRDFLGAKKVG